MSLPRIICLLALAALLFPAYGAEKTTYFHWDAQDSPVAATDEAGNVIWREEYRPYGDRIRNEPAAQANTRWYTGHPHDDDTGLTYMGARYYDPVVGRFMATDPKGFSEDNPHSFNRYAYANNNPHKFVDPDGQVPIIPAIVWVGKAVGEGITDVGLDAAIAQATSQEFSLGDALKSFAIGTGAALVGAGAVNKARKAARLAEITRGGGDILFGQKSVRRIFTPGEEGSNFEFAGKSIAELASGLRSGSISPNQLPIEFVVHNGQRVAVNNRSLTALRRAGLRPTRTIDVTSDPVKRARVRNRLREMGGSPSDTIRVRGAGPNTSAIF